MHSFSYITALGALLTAAFAVPVKRELIINTVTEIDTVTEYATATVWVDADNVPATTVISYSPASPTTTSSSGTTVFAIVPTSPKAEVIPAPAATTTSTTTSTTTPATTPQVVAQTHAAETPTTTAIATTPIATPTTTTTPMTTTTTPAAAVATTQSSSSSGSGTTYTGELTFYDVGLGSCGITNVDTDMVVAMAIGLMNKATMCGKTITINYGGVSHTATVVDTCPGCSAGSLDLSPSLFDVFASQSLGRVKGATWSFN